MLKKMLAALLVVALFLSAGCGRHRRGLDELDEIPRPEHTANPEPLPGAASAPADNLSPSKTINFWNRYLRSGSFTLTLELDLFEQPMTLAIRDNDVYVSVLSQGLAMDFILLDGEGYAVLHALKAYVRVEDESTTSDIQDALDDPPALEKLRTGTVEIDGKVYDYEEFGDDSARYCFDGDTLAYIQSADGSTSDGHRAVTMKVLELSDTADESLFEIPEDYTELSSDLGEELAEAAREQLKQAA